MRQCGNSTIVHFTSSITAHLSIYHLSKRGMSMDLPVLVCPVCGPTDTFAETWKVMFEKRDRALARKPLSEADANTIAQLDGSVLGVRSFMASNAGGRFALAHNMAVGLRELWDGDPLLEAVHVTIILDSWATSDEVTIFDLRRIQTEARAILELMGRDWSAAIEIQVFANVKHPSGGKLITPHVHAVVPGRGIVEHAQAIAARMNATLRAPVANMTPIIVRRMKPDWTDWATVIRYPFKGIDKNKTLYLNEEKGKADIHESEKGDRYVRYLRLFQIHSLVRQQDLMFASGTGVTLQSSALLQTRRSLRAEGLVGGSVRMRDIRALWADLMPRLGWTRFQLPSVAAP